MSQPKKNSFLWCTFLVPVPDRWAKEIWSSSCWFDKETVWSGPPTAHSCVFGCFFFHGQNCSLREFVSLDLKKKKVAKVLDHMCERTCELHACQPYQLTWLPRPLRRCASPQARDVSGVRWIDFCTSWTTEWRLEIPSFTTDAYCIYICIFILWHTSWVFDSWLDSFFWRPMHSEIKSRYVGCLSVLVSFLGGQTWQLALLGQLHLYVRILCCLVLGWMSRDLLRSRTVQWAFPAQLFWR